MKPWILCPQFHSASGWCWVSQGSLLTLISFTSKVDIVKAPAQYWRLNLAYSVSALRYVKTARHTIQVDHIEYMDEIASLAGVKPNLLLLFLSDPTLAMEVFFGPCTPYQYRLQGPGKWDGARRAILTQRERIIKPLKTRITSEKSRSAPGLFWIKMALFGLAFLVPSLTYFSYICQW